MLARSANQALFLSLLRTQKPPIVCATGPAGTGKTFLACSIGAEALVNRRIDRLVLTRPAVSVEEQHGFLPGTLERKMDPWTRPMFDALRKYYTPKQLQIMIQEGIIEICPLAYMRGRSFEKSWIVADEMQNSTQSQMRMVLTRIGEGSKLVLTGDPSQHDRGYEENGFMDFLRRLDDHPSSFIEHVEFNESEIVRHPVIKEVLEIYK